MINVWTKQSGIDCHYMIASMICESKLEKIIIRFDGAAKGNPGPAGCGFALLQMDGSVITSRSRSLGATTNNVAEYQGLIAGCTSALKYGYKNVQIEGDSALVCKQITGEWKIKSAHLYSLLLQAQALMKQFSEVVVHQIPRIQNELADRLASNAALGSTIPSTDTISITQSHPRTSMDSDVMTRCLSFGHENDGAFSLIGLQKDHRDGTQ